VQDRRLHGSLAQLARGLDRITPDLDDFFNSASANMKNFFNGIAADLENIADRTSADLEDVLD
jgi:hypothetical protein